MHGTVFLMAIFLTSLLVRHVTYMGDLTHAAQECQENNKAHIEEAEKLNSDNAKCTVDKDKVLQELKIVSRNLEDLKIVCTEEECSRERESLKNEVKRLGETITKLKNDNLKLTDLNKYMETEIRGASDDIKALPNYNTKLRKHMQDTSEEIIQTGGNMRLVSSGKLKSESVKSY